MGLQANKWVKPLMKEKQLARQKYGEGGRLMKIGSDQ